MKPGFVNSTLDVRTGDGLDDVLLGWLDYIRPNGDLLRAPIGGTTDGFSVPRCLQSIIPATGGDWFSAVLHDSAYRNQLLILPFVGTSLDAMPEDSKLFVLASFSQKESDTLILEAMASQGVGEFEQSIIYNALRMYGGSAFAEDRANNKISTPRNS